MPRRALKWVGWLLLALVLLIAATIALFDWNWLKGPLERKVLDKTGRQLVINGDLKVKLGWPLAHVDAAQVTFANPSWARGKQMLVADEVVFTLALPKLFTYNILMPEVELKHPVIVLERSGDGRENWRLDREQLVDNSNFRIGVLRLDQGRLTYDDPAQTTSIQADISTANAE